MKKSPARTIICLLASMLLSIFVSVLAIMLSVELGFATNNSLTSALDEVKYYERLYNDFMDKCESIVIPDGLGPEVFDGVFSVEQLKSDGNAYLNAQLNSTVYKTNLDWYKEQITTNIKEYVDEKQLVADGDEDEIIEDIVENIMDYYIKMISIPYASTIGSIFRTISALFPYVFFSMLVFAMITIWIINKQNPHKKNRVFRYLAYATTSGAITTLIPPIYCLYTKFYTKIQVYPEYLYDFIVRYIENGIKIMLLIGMILFLASIVMIALSTYLKHKYIHTRTYHHHHHRSGERSGEEESEA
ncbi:MAG: hypothetical protein II919_06100 [Lachnospiraceae bacterium]|nr:hypothetical protein [Lachnospiraceae bacterium]